MVKVWTALWKLESLFRNCGEFQIPSIKGRAFRLRLFRIYSFGLGCPLDGSQVFGCQPLDARDIG